MAISGTATNSAAQPATGGSVLNPVDLVNNPDGYPATETWPGSIDPTLYTDAGPLPPQEYGQWPGEQFAGSTPGVLSGGGYADLSYQTGHDAPTVPWDSSAGKPFAPSRAVDPALHDDYGSGAVYEAETVVPAVVTGLTRRTQVGQTWNQDAPTQTNIGLTDPNGRTDLDQYQTWAPVDGGHAPWWTPTAERPLFNNLAYEATGTTPDGGYEVAGMLPDNSQWAYAAQTYYAPPDPSVSAPTPQANTAGSFYSGAVLR